MADLSQFTLDEFLQLPTEQVAGLIRGLTVGFPIDGTRRWFLLHYPQVWDVNEYKALTGKRYVEEFAMLFDHGVETILVPAFGSELMGRGEEYVSDMMEGLARLAQHPTFADFYRDYNVRVRFYGDWRRQVRGLPGADELTAALDNCVATRNTGSRRLFYALWADDILMSVVNDLARARGEHEQLDLTREAIVTRYYGEYVKPTDIYIGFGRPTVFDVPMLVTSQTDLYYTVVPSLDVDARLFRMMAWDHFVGRWTQQEWDGLTEQDFKALKTFYEVNHDTVLGLGEVDPLTGIWHQRGLAPIDKFRRE
jgi:tuberculosinol/isotuberculosinol synthase